MNKRVCNSGKKHTADLVQYRLLAFLLMFVLAMTGCKKVPQPPDKLTEAIVDGKSITFKPNDELSADAWNELDITYNKESYDKVPLLYKGITIGSSQDEFLKAFDIKPGYAMVDREIDAGDGCTDIICEEYQNLDFYQREEVLDAVFIFGYQKKDGEWKMIPYQKLNKIYHNPKKASDVLLYQIDICGPQMEDEVVRVGDVIKFFVSYLN